MSHPHPLPSSRATRHLGIPTALAVAAAVLVSACAARSPAQNDGPAITVDEAAGEVAPPPVLSPSPTTSAPAASPSPTASPTPTPTPASEPVPEATDTWVEPATDSPLQEPPSPAPAPETGPLVAFQRGGQIVVMHPDGSAQRTLVDGSDPAWSPDGRRLAFTNSGGGIGIVDADGSNVLHLTAYGRNPDWSPDGVRLVFQTDRDPTTGAPIPYSDTGTGGYLDGTGSRLYVVAVDGSGLRRITEFNTMEPAWSPDGSRIAFAGYWHDMLWLFVASPDGSQQIVLNKGSGHNPAWNPAGTMIAFEDSNHGTPESTGISVFDLATKVVTQLIRADQLHATRPSWSPDGATILFTRAPAGADAPTSIAVMNADGSGLRDLTSGPTDGGPDERAAIG